MRRYNGSIQVYVSLGTIMEPLAYLLFCCYYYYYYYYNPKI